MIMVLKLFRRISFFREDASVMMSATYFKYIESRAEAGIAGERRKRRRGT